MSYKKFEQVDILANNRFALPKYFICDTADDIKNLPGLDKAAWGSVAVVLDGGVKYVLRENGEWKELKG